jgi:hypothetical protein
MVSAAVIVVWLFAAAVNTTPVFSVANTWLVVSVAVAARFMLVLSAGGGVAAVQVITEAITTLVVSVAIGTLTTTCAAVAILPPDVVRATVAVADAAILADSAIPVLSSAV